MSLESKLNEKMKKESYYVTTPVYYVNGDPHLGHAYTTLAADTLARNNRLLGKDVFFLTGTDEHGQKIEKAAKEEGTSPKEFVDEFSDSFKSLFEELGITYDKFIRTTSKHHAKAVKHLYKQIKKDGDIYKGKYEGLYCVECESYKTEKDLENGKCPIHNKEPTELEEESYFFRLSNYEDELLEFFEKDPNFISPKGRKQELINKIEEGLEDISISRKNVEWGIPLPDDPEHTFWVWFDALSNYLSGVGYPDNKEKFEKYWPADLHLIGKDIQWHHMVIWPALLMSANIELPDKIYSHGWLTIKGEKMSKSTGASVDPLKVKEEYGLDPLRYFLFSSVSFGKDAEFTEEDLRKAYNKELADELGNLVNRTVALTEKYYDGEIPYWGGRTGLEEKVKSKLNKVPDLINNLKLSRALSNIFKSVRISNKYLSKKEPWNIEDRKSDKVRKIISSLNESVALIGNHLYPFMPETSEEILDIYKREIESYDDLKWGEITQNREIKKERIILFPKVS